MAGFADILGALVQSGMSGASTNRAASALGGGAPGGLSDLAGSLGRMMGGAGGAGGAGGLGGMLGQVLSGVGQSAGGNRNVALGGLGALAGALLGGGAKSARGAIGGGSLAMLAALAFSALKKAGQQPAQPPSALFEPANAAEEQALENDAALLVKAMINAAKADGRIDEAEVQKIAGKLEQDGLTQEEKDFFFAEANKPMDLDGVIQSGAGRPDLAAQLYAASLLAIQVDTPAEQQYMQDLAVGLNLHPQVIEHIESTLGLTR